jgi:tetratricopeptide (TPR) repeat protein
MLEELSEGDKELLKSSLKKYHLAKDDTSKINALVGICENMQNDDWSKYQFYQHKLITDAISAKPSKKELKSLKKSLASSLNNIGVIYNNEGQLKEALDYYGRALKIEEEIGDKNGIASSLISMGHIYNIKGQIKEAMDYYGRALKISQEIGYPIVTERVARRLSGIYEKQGKGMKALEMYKLYVQMNDSINNEATQKATIRQQTQYEFEKAQIVKENEAKEQVRVIAEETGRRNNLQYSLIFLGILVLFVAILMLGFIKVSPNVAEGLIFFAFLILFEFVLVFSEPYLEQYTNGEPMYNLLANSVLAILIFPVHSILERLLKKRIVKS